ncbi:MAG: peptide ABC transporter substrate-binding protein [Oscillibacter sp.]
MNKRTRWAALALTAAMALTVLTGCSKDEEAFALSVSVGGAPATLDPIYAVAETDQTVLSHLYEGLMRTTVSVSGESAVVNGMAKSVSPEDSHDGTVTYTFKLRNAKWSDGEAVTAGDFVYAWQRLANPANHAPNAALLSMVVGFQEARRSGDMSLLQVTAKNDSTLVVVLNGPCSWFLSEVCTAPATAPLREDVVLARTEAAKTANAAAEKVGGAGSNRWWSDALALVTNGPYRVTESTDTLLDLTVNPRYTGLRPGPTELTLHYADTPEAAAALYADKTVDFVWALPEEQLAALDPALLARELSTYTVLFNVRAELFTDPLVRQALFLAIDRNAVAALAGVTAKPAGGLVPECVPQGGEGFRSLGGDLLDNKPEKYAELCGQARDCLQEAGYDSGLNIAPLEYLYVDQGTNAAVAQALAGMWRDVLRVRVQPVAVTEQELQTALQTGNYTMAAADVTAVGNDAECFLMQWDSASVQNVSGYANSAYDTLMSIIASASDDTARMGCLHDAENLLLADHVLSPLYTTGTDWTLRERYTGLSRDARGWFNFSSVTQRTA